MNERKILKHGQAKVQFYACRTRVQQLREEGYSIRVIYDKLIEGGEITMSYKALHNNLSKDQPKPVNGTSQRPIKPPHSASRTVAKSQLKPLGKSINRSPVAVSVPPAMPTSKIISVTDMMAKKQAELKEFSESQFVPDEAEDGHKT